MHGDYFLLTGGLERSLYRITPKHAAVQPRRLALPYRGIAHQDRLRKPAEEFNRMLRKVVERNQLPEYDLKLMTTQDGSPALFVVSRMAALEGAVTAELAHLNARDGLPPPAKPQRIVRKTLAKPRGGAKTATPA